MPYRPPLYGIFWGHMFCKYGGWGWSELFSNGASPPPLPAPPPPPPSPGERWGVLLKIPEGGGLPGEGGGGARGVHGPRGIWGGGGAEAPFTVKMGPLFGENAFESLPRAAQIALSNRAICDLNLCFVKRRTCYRPQNPEKLKYC